MRTVSDAVDIWIARLDKPDLLGVPNTAWDDILSAEELERRSRLRFANDRKRFTIAHVLLRTRLSCYANVAPEEWAFTHGRYGKPILSAQLMATHQLHFSLSHAGTVAVCAITRAGIVGVDVEPLDHALDVEGLAPAVLTSQEQASLNGLDALTKRQRFLTLWTLKEAYIKALGVGLSLPLQSFGFHGDPLRFVDSHNKAENWMFESRMFDGGIIVSYAVNTALDCDLNVTICKIDDHFHST